MTPRLPHLQHIGQFLTENVEAGTTIKTDGWRGYSQTAQSAYRHEAAPSERARHIRACQKQADAVFARGLSPDCSPAKLCALARTWVALTRMSEHLLRDLDRASGEK